MESLGPELLARLEKGASLRASAPFEACGGFHELPDFDRAPAHCLVCNGVAPNESLFYALGLERAAKLPAWHGNFLVRHDGVAGSLDVTRAVIGVVRSLR